MKLDPNIPTTGPSHGTGARFTDPETHIEIVREPEQRMFPDAWYDPPLSTKADALDAAEADRYVNILRREFKKYPPELVRETANEIYLVKNLVQNGAKLGGTASIAFHYVYLAADPSWFDYFLALDFHHEVAHLLVHGSSSFFWSGWKKLNPSGFHYDNDVIEGIQSDKYNPSCYPVG